jgi:DNA-directed RNA polymerase subunit M/transcription elongation factor TFIIS
MALEFKCPKCRQSVISGFLQRGETMPCPHCAALIEIPEYALDTNKVPSIKTKKKKNAEETTIKVSHEEVKLNIIEREDIWPICPYCEKELCEINAISKGWGLYFAKNTVFFCPFCHKVLGFGQSRMM